MELFNYAFGPINYLLGLLHLGRPTWTADPGLALPALIFVDLWQRTLFMTLLLFAGLRSLPEAVVEAARMDLSTAWQIVWRIYLPLLRPIIGIALILRVLMTFKLFDIIYVLTAGGPGTVTENLAFFTYIQGFRYFNLGYASALRFTSSRCVYSRQDVDPAHQAIGHRRVRGGAMKPPGIGLSDLACGFALAIALFVFLAPVLWMLITAVKPPGEWLNEPPVFIPSELHWANFTDALFKWGGLKGLTDSLIVASLSTALSLLLGVPAAYAIGRYQTGGDNLSFTVLSILFMPPVAVAIPMYLFWSALGLIDTLHRPHPAIHGVQHPVPDLGVERLL